MGIITLIIIITTCLVSISAFSNRDTFNKLLFDPYLIDSKKQGYRFFTHAFVHVDWMHLGFNMIALYSFGSLVEKQIYPILTGEATTYEELYSSDFYPKAMFYYILLYVGGIFFSSLWSFGKHRHNPHYTAVGASGAVSAVIMPFILYAPWAQLQVFFIPMWGWLFGILYLVGSWYMGKRNIGNIGHDAHFWGAVFGILFTILMDAICKQAGDPSIVQTFIHKLLNGPHPQ